MNLRSLEIFQAVLKHHSLNRASQYLQISQPAVSISLKRLEKQLGVQLFSRSGNRVYTTDAGRLLEEYATRLLATLNELNQAFDELKGLQRGHLFCGAGATTATFLLPKVLVEFKKQYPSIDNRLLLGNAQETERRLLANEIDLGLVAGKLLHPERLTIIPCFADELVVIVPLHHPLAKRSRIDPQRLSSYPLILREKGSPTRELIDKNLQTAGVSYRCMMELESTEAIKRAVSEGLGISIVSLYSLEQERKAKLLFPVRISGGWMNRQFLVIMHKDSRPPRPVAAFMEILMKVGPQLVTPIKLIRS